MQEEMKNLGKKYKGTLNKNNWHQKYEDLMHDALQDSSVKRFLYDHKSQINHDILENGKTAIYEFVQAKSNMDNFAPGYEPKLSISNNAIHVIYTPGKDLQAKRKLKQFDRKFMTIDMASDIRHASLNDFSKDIDGRGQAYKAAIDFLYSYFDQKKFTPGLYLSGDFGVGKTYLLSAIANELVQKNIDVLLMHFPTFAVNIKSSIGDNTVMQQINQIKKVPVLMLDDIGADSLSSWIRDEVLGVILQYRMQEQLTTFFSSNFSMNELQKNLAVNQRGDREPVKADRLMERIKFLSREVVISGKDRRQK